MTDFKHYSFDFWMTLIRSDSRFKVARATYIYTKYNPYNISYINVERIIRDVDVMCNLCNETTGLNIDAYEMYYMVLTQLGHKDVTFEMLQNLYRETERMFMTFPPAPYDDDTIDVLRELRHRGKTISVTSNTGFIKGELLRSYIDESPFYALFDFVVFSDECRASKPSPIIFSEMYELAKIKHDELPLEKVLHVGDNDNADGKGATVFGIPSLIINSNNGSIKDLL